MAKTIELTIRNDGDVVYSSVADVGDDFDQAFLAAYSANFPGITDNSELYSKAARGIIDNIMNVIGLASSTPVRQFAIRGERNSNPNRSFRAFQQPVFRQRVRRGPRPTNE